MTSSVRYQENANRAKRELAAVKAQASQIIGGMVCLIKSMYVFGDFQNGTFNGRPMDSVVSDLIAADTAADMLKALGEDE